MSRNSTAYFAIVGTLAFALPGAASAGQINIPHINIPRPQVNIPQINIPRPQISVPTPHPSVPTPRLSVPTPNSSISKVTITTTSLALKKGAQGGQVIRRAINTLTPGSGTGSSPGSASAMPVSSTGGSYPTVETASFRCRSKSNCPG
jgi:hypothetical protein